MATETVTIPQAHAESGKPFRTDHEDVYVPGFDNKPAAALMIRVDATHLALASAALARADLLRKSLMAWSCVSDSGGVEASEVASALEPAAQEALMLLTELVGRLARAEKAWQTE